MWDDCVCGGKELSPSLLSCIPLTTQQDPSRGQGVEVGGDCRIVFGGKRGPLKLLMSKVLPSLDCLERCCLTQ